MKRKLALLLATVMTITALPMTVSAATTNRLSKGGTTGADKTVVYEDGAAGTPSSSTVENFDDVEYFIEGGYLDIELKDDLKLGTTFKVELENSKFFFRNVAPVAGTIAKDTTGGVIRRDLLRPYAAGYDVAGDFFDEVQRIAGVNQNGTQWLDVKGHQTGGGVTPQDQYEITYLTEKSEADFDESDITNSIPKLSKVTYNTDEGVYFPGSKVYFRFGATNNIDRTVTPNVYKDAPYALAVSDVSAKVGTIIVGDNLKKGDIIRIPLVTKLSDDGEYVINIEKGNNVNVTGGRYVFAEKSTGKTNTSAESLVTARTDFELKPIIIKEEKIGSIKKDGKFELKAPSGYEFNIDKVEVYTELGLTWVSNGKAGLGDKTADYKLEYKKDRTGNTDRSILVFDLADGRSGVTPSTTTRGAIYLKNLRLIADDDDRVSQDKELSLSITDKSPDGRESFSDQSFKVAKVSDYTISLTKVDSGEVPLLVSGRLEGDVRGTNLIFTDNLDDAYHKAAKVKFAEKIAAAWWAERSTVFTLPKDVTILKAKFSKITNFDSDAEKGLKEGNAGGRNDSVYYNTRKKSNKVTIDDNELKLSLLKVITDKKGSFELELWLGADVSFEGDIDLVLSNYTTDSKDDEKDIKVTIAKAIRPIEVKTSVTEVKIGLQYVSVGDFTITETKAGNLFQGEDVYVSVTDGISIDMEIAKGFTAKVTSGDMKISNVTTASILGSRNAGTVDGQISFTINRESTEASTVEFSNVQVKVDRNAPYSNISNADDRGIDLVVWGPAVAKNYYHLGVLDKTVNNYDLFLTPGISTKYINVATVANTNESKYTNVVKVTIGNPVIQINNVDNTMPMAAYVSTASNSTMVPVRFIAVALGLPESAVKWDPTARTATVDAGNRVIQFQIGNTNYLVNGVSVPMVSPDGLPVAAEISNDRACIPFRALGEAFDIVVDWDQPTSTATYNAPSKQ